LLLTFSGKDAMDGKSSQASGGGFLASTMLLPRFEKETAGRFRVWLVYTPYWDPYGVTDMRLLWDRKMRGGFPEIAELVRITLLLFDNRNVWCATA